MSMNSSGPFSARISDSSNDRKRQIDTVKVFNDNVSEISHNEEYSVEFIAGVNKLAMLIILGPDFPKEKPLLKITPSISHQWVNENSEIVSAPGYLNFSIHSDLGRVVHVIIRELQRNPPPLKQELSPVSFKNRSTFDDNNVTYSSSEEYEQSFEVMSSVICRLHKMSVDDLRKLDEDQNSLNQFVNELPHMRSMKQTFLDMINATKEIERRKADLEFKIQETRPDTDEKHKELDACKANCKLLYDEYVKLQEVRSPENVKKQLKQFIASVDVESESLAENFLHSKISLDEFLSQYKVLRMKVHGMRMKEERMNGKLKIQSDMT